MSSAHRQHPVPETGRPRPAPSAAERSERKRRLLSHGQSAMTRSIAEALVMKDGNLFFLTMPAGEVPTLGGHGLGLYYHDCRYLNGYTVRLADTDPTVLVAQISAGDHGVLELTNVDLHAGDQVIPKETIALTWRRQLDGQRLCLTDELTITNLGLTPVAFPLVCTFDAGFEDVFTVRALLDERHGKLAAPRWHGSTLVLAYAGADGLNRELGITCAPRPARRSKGSARWDMRLDGRASQTLRLELAVSEAPAAGQPAAASAAPDAAPELPGQWASAASSSPLLNDLLERSTRDLEMLLSSIGHQTFFAAGLPWFGTLFGRDSLITALQVLAFNPIIAEQTLRLLASRQGTAVDARRDEQPGKILHELRVGELAHLGEIPHTPYYGTIDATPLFLILLAEHAEWTGSLALYRDLHGAVDLALRWLDEFGDSDGDGYLDYHGQTDKGLINQGWKDSGDSIVNADGSKVRPPVALVEVQGYAYRARLGIAALAERAGEAAHAQQLRQAAQALRQRFNRDFWSEALGCYVLALQAGGQPAAVVASNPGQALWTGIADSDKAQRTVARLMAGDMFNGWGIRTLSAEARRYNPIGYHLGTVWPHDNALIAAGFRRYGRDDEALRLVGAMCQASLYFGARRLPELFSGFDRRSFSQPVPYPVACHPQAWAAGAALHLVQLCLGLQPRAFEHKLLIERPVLPSLVDWLELDGVRVGGAVARLRFTRQPGGTAAGNAAAVEVLDIRGDALAVDVQPAAATAIAEK